MRAVDAIVVGGGPAGSSCAYWLVRGGLDVAVLDRSAFPRVKLCAGWLSEPVWEALDLAPETYPNGLWRWRRCHVFHRGARHTVRVDGYFIRRCEFDTYLLERSGAHIAEGSAVRSIARDDEGLWCVDDRYRASFLIGAGGTHCPVARTLFPKKPRPPVGVQEHEFEADEGEIAGTRVGLDGEPELLLHDRLDGYAWNVPKTDWLNVGCGTSAAREVLPAWRCARSFFEERGHVPRSSTGQLDRMRGHSYYLYDPRHLADSQRQGAFIVGDALGLAHPLTAEGILPAVVSGRLCAESILDGAPESYPRRLAAHPLLRQYRLVYRAREAASRFLGKRSGSGPRDDGETSRSGIVSGLSSWAVAATFAKMFSGRPLPGSWALERVFSGQVGSS